MRSWRDMVRIMPSPSLGMALCNFLLLFGMYFLLSGHYVFLPGVKGVDLAVDADATILRTDMAVISVTREGKYIYMGQRANSWKDLERDLDSIADGSTIVFQVDKALPYTTLIEFLPFARKKKAKLFLVTDTMEEFSGILDNNDGKAKQ